MARTIVSNEAVTVGGNVEVRSIPNTNSTVTVVGGTVTFDAEFNRGGDTIILQGNAASYTAVLSGSSVILTNGAGTTVTIPVGANATTVTFADASRPLQISNGQVVLGSQTVDNTADPVSPGTGGGGTGAFNLTVSVEDDATPGIAEGQGSIVYRLTLDNPPTSPITFNVSTGAPGDTATGGADYTPVAQQVTFGVGQTVAFVTVPILNDNVFEADETVTLVVTPLAGSNVTVGQSGRVALILNDDANPDTIPQSIELTTGSDTFTGSEVADIINGSQNLNSPGKLLSTNDFIDGRGGIDTLILNNAPNPGVSTVLPNQLDDADLTNVVSVERLQTNYNVVTLGTEASQAGLNNVDATATGNVDTLSAGAGTGITLTASSAYTLDLTATLSQFDDTVVVDVTSGADSINTGLGDDTVAVTSAGNVRLTFTSAEVGNGAVGDSGNVTGQDGGLAVRLQNEDSAGELTGAVSRYDDEGVRFVNTGTGLFDVRDISGTARGEFAEAALGTSGSDVIGGGGASIYINAGAGDDALFGTTGADFLVGGMGNDYVEAGAGVDSVLGGAGNDTIEGGAGADSLDGGAGDDTFVFGLGQFAAEETVAGGDGTDTLNVEDSSTAITDALFVNKTGVEILDVDNITLGAGNEVTLGANAQAAGITTVNVDSGGDVDASTYTVGLTVSTTGTIVTGSGADTVTINGATNANITLNAGNDTVNGGQFVDASDTLRGGDGNDTLNISGNNVAGTATTRTIVFDGDFTGFEQVNLAAGAAAVSVAAGADTAASATSYDLTVVNANVTDGSTLTVNASALRSGVARILGADGEIGGGDDTLANETLEFDASALTGNRAVNVTGGASSDTVTGGAGADVISGGAGNDFLFGGDGVDTILGGEGDDEILGGAFADSLDGGEGSDTYVYFNNDLAAAEIIADSGTSGTDTLEVTNGSAIGDALFANKTGLEVLTTNITNGAGAEVTLGANAQAAGFTTVNSGDDDVTATAAFTNNLTVTGSGTITTSTGNDTVTTTGTAAVNTGGGNDTIVLGGVGVAQNVNGGEGNDTIQGGANVTAADTINGGAGTDTLVLDGPGVTGTYTVAFDADLSGVEIVSLTAGDGPVAATGADTAGFAQSYDLTFVNDNIATGGTLTVDGSTLRSGATTTLGADGEIGGADGDADATANETLRVDGSSITGNRVLIVNGGASADTVFGGAGADTISGNGGADSLFGGGGADSLLGGAGNDTLNGGAGADTMLGGEGDDFFVMSIVEFNSDADVIDGGAGTNTLVLNSGNTDPIVADVGFNTRFTNVTNVLLVGDATGGPDTFTYTAGSFAQGAGVRTISVGPNAVGNISAANYTVGITLNGGALNDTLTGSNQNDTINGGAGADSIVAVGGDDTITVAGADSVDAGDGNDTITVTDAANVSIVGGNGNDTVVGGSFITAADTLTGGAGTDTLRLGAGTAAIVFDGDFTGFEAIVLDAGTSAAAVDGANNDTAGVAAVYDLTVGTGNVSDGVFTVDASALRAGVVTGLGGNGEIGGGDDTTTDETLDLDVSSFSTAERLSVTGGAGGDTIQGGAGVDTINGGAGADSLVGNGGNDTILAGNGADTVIGGAGADGIDITESSAARDLLVVGNGESLRIAYDIITGFDIDEDSGEDAEAGLAATADVIDFGSAVLTGTNITDGVVSGILATNVQQQASFLSAVQLIEQELQSQGALQSGTLAFEFQGSTYVAEVTNNGVDSDSETITDIVQLIGVTGVDALENAGGTSVGLIGG